MIIGIPKEIKTQEKRVAATPDGVAVFARAGHTVVVERDAGIGSGYEDEAYVRSGARIADDAAEVWSKADLVMKVKEPLPSEYRFFRDGLVLFAYLHLAAEPELAAALRSAGVVAVAYETVERNGVRPLLTPMSEVAGRMSVQIGARLLEGTYGGKGILLGGVPGVERGRVTIIGGGVVGTNAARIAVGLGAAVTILDVSPDRLRQLEDLFGGAVQTLVSAPRQIEDSVAGADLCIGAVLIPGAKAPKLVSADVVKRMRPGSVIVDVAVDQGGIFETADRVTTHDEPTYERFGVIHYAVANMPGAVPRTSTAALTNATLPYAMQLAQLGWKRAAATSPELRSGFQTAGGAFTCRPVADALGQPYVPLEQALAQVGAYGRR